MHRLLRVILGECMMWGAIAALLYACPTDPRWIAAYLVVAMIGATWQIGGKLDDR